MNVLSHTHSKNRILLNRQNERMQEHTSELREHTSEFIFPLRYNGRKRQVTIIQEKYQKLSTLLREHTSEFIFPLRYNGRKRQVTIIQEKYKKLSTLAIFSRSISKHSAGLHLKGLNKKSYVFLTFVERGLDMM